MSSTTTTAAFPAITAENILRLFPDINTSLATAARNSSELDGYDEEQVRLMDEVCIVLDENDVPIGSATKKVCTYLPAHPTPTSPYPLHPTHSRQLTHRQAT